MRFRVMGFRVLGVAAVLALAGWSAAASTVSTVSCEGTERTFYLTTSGGSICAATDAPGGRGTLTGNPSGANPDPLFDLLRPGLVFLYSTGGDHEGEHEDEDGSHHATPPLTGEPSLTSGLSGSFAFQFSSFVAQAGMEYYDFVLAFKSGGKPGTQSVWAAFLLGDGVHSGTWSISGHKGLSHVNLYAHLRSTVALPPPVPLPASAPLLLAGFGALVWLRRKAAAG